MNIDELVGENVRRARIKAGVSPHELAHRVTGVGLPLSESALLQIEGGEGRIGVDELIALGLSLGMPPAMLLSPLNLGSLLWVDAEGSPMASWALFHDDARSFALPGREDIPDGTGMALGPTLAAVARPESPPEMQSAEVPPSPAGPDRERQYLQTADLSGALFAPAPANAGRTNVSLIDSGALAALSEDTPPAPAGADDFWTASEPIEPDTKPPEEPAVLPPDPAPRQKPAAGRRDGEPSPHRAWAMEALRMLLEREH